VSFYRNAAGLLLTSTAGIVIGFATSVLLARYLTPGDRGTYALAVSFAMIAAALARLGWPTASLHRLRRLGSSSAEVTSTGIALVAMLSAVTILIGWLLEPWLTQSLFEGAPRLIVRLALCSAPALMLGVLMESIARGIDRFAIGNWYRVLALVSIFCAVLLVLVVRDGDVVEMMIAYLTVQTACAVGITLVVVRQTGLSASVDLSELGNSAGFAIKNYATSLSERLHERLDVFLIAYFASPVELAFYVIAVSITGRMRMPAEALAQAAYPQLAELNEEDASELACDVVRQSFFLMLAAALLLASAAPLLVPVIYGAPYSASVLPLLLLLPGLLGLTVYRVLFRYFMAIDRQGVNIVVQSAALIVNVVLNLLLIPRYGVIGAAVASSVTYSLVAFMIGIVFIGSSGRGPIELLVPTRGDFDAYVGRGVRLLRRALAVIDPSFGKD